MKRFIILVFTLSLFSCTSKQETKDGTFWRMKYEALDTFVKRKGLKPEADKAVKDFELTLPVNHFSVFETHYSLNGKDIKGSELKDSVAGLKGEKDQKINITAMYNVKHQDLLALMNYLINYL